MTINDLLGKRNTRCVGAPGSETRAKARFELSKYLAENYTVFNLMRNHLFRRKEFRRIEVDGAMFTLIIHLRKHNWIAQDDKYGREWKLKTNENSDIKYLKGGWLEEYAFLAHLEAGCEEAYLAQEIEWDVNGTRGENEIDVLARRGGILSFTSCKSMEPYNENHFRKLRDHLLESHYWDTHFADGAGRVLLITTADFYNEILGNRHRFPVLSARAQILQVDMVGLEELKWDVLIDKIRQHWETRG